ncbi:MAG: hypothetical protein IT280_00825 [Ignavibacteria bacterium]|nr:hypothetical protein [Ignavibacteria bacterium]
MGFYRTLRKRIILSQNCKDGFVFNLSPNPSPKKERGKIDLKVLALPLLAGEGDGG